MRLGWSQIPGQIQRRQISSTPQVHDLSSAAVTALLTELDSWPGDGSAQQRGPFSVFSAATSSPIGSHSALDRPEDQSQLLPSDKEDVVEQRVAFPATSPDRSDGINETSPNRATEQNSQVTLSASTLTADDWPLSLVSEPAQDNGSFDITTLLDRQGPRQYSLADSSTSKSYQDNIIDGTSSELAVNSPSPAINPLPLPRPETELVHHWVIFLSGNMMLIDTPDNPCRTTFMPLALKGLDDPSSESNIHLSIFHAICASSAFSLFHLRQDSRYQSLAMHHDQLALGHLRGSLQKAKRLNEPMLAAVLSCITAEAMSGRRSRWRAHVAGGLGLLENEIHGGWIRGPTASRLLQSYLSLSSLCSLPMSTQLISLLNAPSEVRHYLERSHGITTPIVQFLAQMTTTIESKCDIPVEELDRLELQLYLNFPRLSTPGAPGSIIIQHALNSFYYASIIYFRRTLRRVPVRDVQDLVEKAVDELEAVETLTRGKGGCAYNWSSFVVAADCQRQDLQDRMLSWFDRKSRNGIQNVNILCEIVKALWHRRAQAGIDADIHWQELAKEADFDIMLV